MSESQASILAQRLVDERAAREKAERERDDLRAINETLHSDDCRANLEAVEMREGEALERAIDAEDALAVERAARKQTIVERDAALAAYEKARRKS